MNFRKMEDPILFVADFYKFVPSIRPKHLDMCIMSLCDHSIYDYGTFGFWGAYLAGGYTILAQNMGPGENSEVENIKPANLSHWTFLDAFETQPEMAPVPVNVQDNNIVAKKDNSGAVKGPQKPVNANQDDDDDGDDDNDKEDEDHDADDFQDNRVDDDKEGKREMEPKVKESDDKFQEIPRAEKPAPLKSPRMVEKELGANENEKKEDEMEPKPMKDSDEKLQEAAKVEKPAPLARPKLVEKERDGQRAEEAQPKRPMQEDVGPKVNLEEGAEKDVKNGDHVLRAKEVHSNQKTNLTRKRRRRMPQE